MTAIDYTQLTPEQKAEFLKSLSADELKAAAAEADNKKADDRKAYKENVNEAVPVMIKTLQTISMALQTVKVDIFQSCKILVDLKADAFGIKSGQYSHTFTDENGNGLTYGYRVIDGWDDTVTAGEDIIREFLQGLAKDEDSAFLLSMTNKLLKKDAKGNLKASRILELRQVAEKHKKERMIEGVDVIQQAYRPVRSAWYIEAWTTDAQGKKQAIPLSITSVDFPVGTAITELFPVDEEPEAKQTETPENVAV